MKFNWELKQSHDIVFQGLEEYHPFINKIIESLGFGENESEKIQSFLNPNIKDLNSYSLLPEIQKVSKYLLDAKQKNKKVFIHGDFDVDGIVATTILWDFLYRRLEMDVLPIIPNRFDEGYGLSEKTLNKVQEQGGNIVITVDCGIKDIELVKKYPTLDFIITDHHTYPTDTDGKKLDLKAQNLIGVIHPQHPDSKYPFIDICGSTVTWKLIQQIYEDACKSDFLKSTDFDPNEYLELVAISTVTDIMPLIDENRIILTEGLRRIKTSTSIGLNSLLEASGVKKEEIQAYHFGYVIGPRVNAAGRIDNAIEAVKLFSTTKKEKADILSTKLNELNTKRQEISQSLLEKAEDEIKNYITLPKLIFISGENWPEGIIGLVAGKLQEKYSRPIIVASINGQEVRGSARSPKVYDITSALERNSKYLDRFGGHIQAAGFGLQLDNLEALKESLLQDAQEKLSYEDLKPQIDIVCEIPFEDLSTEIVDVLDLLEPFGYGNPKPNFLFQDCEILDIRFIGKNKNHVRLVLESNSRSFGAIGFGQAEDFINVSLGDKIDVVGNIGMNEWNGNKDIQIEIKDFKIKNS